MKEVGSLIRSMLGNIEVCKGNIMANKKNTVGRPKDSVKIFTDEQVAQVEALAAYLSIHDIAYFFDISERSFFDIKNRDPRVEEAYKKGKAKAISFVASKLMNIIREEENTPTKLSAIIFYLKTQAGWGGEAKTDNKPKLKFPESKSPSDIIDTALTSLEQGEITLAEAQKIADLAVAKLNIINRTDHAEEVTAKRESMEELMDKAYTIRKVLEHQEKQNKGN